MIAETIVRKQKITDLLIDESTPSSKVLPLDYYFSYLIHNGDITIDDYDELYLFAEQFLTDISNSEDLTFESQNAKALTTIANEMLKVEGAQYNCRVGITERGSEAGAYVLPDGTIIFSQAIINLMVENGEPGAIIGILAHEVDHLLHKTRSVAKECSQNFFKSLAMGAVHEDVSDVTSIILLSRIGTQTDLLEKAFNILRSSLHSNQRGLIHRSLLEREARILAARQKAHVNGGNRTFNLQKKEIAFTNAELIDQAIAVQADISFEDLAKLNSKDRRKLFSYGHLSTAFASKDIPDHKALVRQLKNKYIIGVAKELNQPLSSFEETALDRFINLSYRFYQKTFTAQDVLRDLQVISSVTTISKLNTIVIESELSGHLTNQNDIAEFIIQTLFFELDKLFSDQKDNPVASLTQENIDFLIDYILNSPFLSDSGKSSCLQDLIGALLLMFAYQEIISDQDQEFIYRNIAKIIQISSSSNPSGQKRAINYIKDRYDKQRYLTYDKENYSANKTIIDRSISFVSKAYDYFSGSHLDQPKEKRTLAMDWPELQIIFKNCITAIEKNPERSTRILSDMIYELDYTLNGRFLKEFTVDWLNHYYQDFIFPLAKILFSLITQIDLKDIKKILKLVSDFFSLLHLDSHHILADNQTKLDDSCIELIKDENTKVCHLFFEKLTLISDNTSPSLLVEMLRDIFSLLNTTDSDIIDFIVISKHEFWKLLSKKLLGPNDISSFSQLQEVFQNIKQAFFRTSLEKTDLLDDSFLWVVLFPDLKYVFLNLISTLDDSDIPEVIEFIERNLDTEMIDVLSLVSKLKWRYLKSSLVSFEDKCLFWKKNALFFHESGLSELANQAKNNQQVDYLLEISSSKATDLISGKSGGEDLTAAYMVDFVFDVFSDEMIIELLETSLPNNVSGSTRIALNWFQYHDLLLEKNLEHLDLVSRMSYKSKFGYQLSKSITRLISTLKNLAPEIKIAIVARALSSQRSPLLDQNKRKRLAEIICELAGEKNTVTELLLKSTVEASDQSYLLFIISEGLGPLLFSGVSTKAIDVEKILNSFSSNRKLKTKTRKKIKQVLSLQDMNVTYISKKKYLRDPEFMQRFQSNKGYAQTIEAALQSHFLENTISHDRHRIEISNRVKILEKTGAHLVKAMQVASNLLSNISPQQRVELANSKDSMQAVSEYMFLVKLKRLAQEDARVKQFVDSIVEYGGPDNSGLYVGGGSLFSVFRVKITDGTSEKWVADEATPTTLRSGFRLFRH